MTKSLTVIETLQQYINPDEFEQISWVNITEKTAEEIVVELKKLFPGDPKQTRKWKKQFVDELIDVMYKNWLDFKANNHIRLRKNFAELIDLDSTQVWVYEDIMGNEKIACIQYLRAINNTDTENESKTIAFYNLWVISWNNWNHWLAIYYFNQVLDSETTIEKKNKALNNLGLAYILIEFYDKAFELLDQVIKNGQSNELLWQANSYIAIMYFQKKEYEKSLEYFKNALKYSWLNKDKDINQEMILLLMIWTTHLFENQSFDKAIEFYQLILKSNPTQELWEEVTLRIGLVYHDKKDYTTAEKYLQEAINSNDNNFSYLAKTALVLQYIEQKNFDQAIVYWNEIITYLQSNSTINTQSDILFDVYNMIGNIYSNNDYNKKNVDLAKEYLQKALDIALNNENYIEADEIRKKINTIIQ
jgi:tetratricopeptide (TPR) repeat protein